jgi:competence protein ComEC
VRAPASLPAAAILAGAVLGTLLAGAVSPLPAVALLFAALLLAVVSFSARLRAPCVASLVVAFGSGAFALAVRAESDAVQPPIRETLCERMGRGPIWLEGTVREDASTGPNGVAFTLDVERWKTARAWEPLTGGVRLNVGGSIGAARAPAWRGGRTVRLPATLRLPGRYQDPGVPDGRLALARRGVALVGSVKSGALVELVREGNRPAEMAARVRLGARRAVDRRVGRLDPQAAAIVIAILIGDRAGLDDDVQRRLQEAGTYHVIAISGGNIAIVTGVLLWMLGMAGVGHRAGSWLTMAAVVAYACVVGGGASVTRATLMAVLYLVARQADHRAAPLNALAAAAALLVVASPSSVADVGFWLTFGATLGILAGVGRAASRLPRSSWLRGPAALFLTSACAELALLPVSAWAFSRVTFAGLALNFVAIPMMSVAQLAGMLVVPLDRLSGAAADLAGWVAYLGATGLVRSAGLVDLAPWSSYRVPPPHALAIGLYYVGWAGWLIPWRRGERGGRAGCGPRAITRLAQALVVASGAWILVDPVTLVAPGVCGRLRVTVLDVAHGDAVLVQLPDRRSLLVDAGGTLGGSGFDVGGRVVAPSLWALGTRRLDVFLLSHADPDHAGGAAAIVRDFHPREIWEGIPVPPLAILDDLRRQAAAAGIPWRERRAGDAFQFGEVSVRVWHPPPPDWERQRVRNDDSVVVELSYRGVSFVLPGDAGREVERLIAPRFAAARLRVLKVPHHGSATSSSASFVTALGPRVVALSAGASTKVSDDVLRRYAAAGADLYRTDRDGAISFDTDGRSIVVSTFGGRRQVITSARCP